jgi:hypothetical protein
VATATFATYVQASYSSNAGKRALFMRIDTYTSSHSLDRPGRNRADNSYHEIQSEEVIRRDQPVNSGPVQGLGSTPLIRRVEPVKSDDEAEAAIESEFLTAREYAYYEQPVSARNARALASYDSIAMLPRSAEASQIVGLDLYA